MNPLVTIPSSNLESLKSGFSHGSLKHGVSTNTLIQSGAPSEIAGELNAYIRDRKLPSEFTVTLIESILDARTHAHNVALTQSLVVTGPEVSHATNLKTGSRFLRIVEHAKRELTLATFALYRGDQILEPIHQAMTRNPDLAVTLIINISRGYGDKTVSSDLIDKQRQEFLTKHWPWEKRPAVYYYSESLHLEAKSRGSMHAKFLIADEERCFITSANFTEAAQTRNIEIGVELTNSQEPKALSRYFKRLIEEQQLAQLL
ncbi:MAG: DISARM system phospholipase D-like protein DrmC [Verrucomicrobiales bacterium]